MEFARFGARVAAKFMGIHDRDYMQGSRGPEPGWSGGGGRSGRPVIGKEIVVWIFIGISVAIYLLQMAQPYQRGATDGSLSGPQLFAGQLQQLLTYQFVHGSLFHLVCNMLALHFLGREIVRSLGVVNFVVCYLVGGIASGLTEIGFQAAVGYSIPLVGASGSVSALLGLWAVIMPRQRIGVFLFFIIPVRGQIMTFALGWLVINIALAVLTLVYPFANVAWLAHAGGTVYGLAHGLVSRKLLRGGGLSRPRPQPRQPSGPTIVPGNFGQRPEPDYNAILDKINREGIGSLTEAEKQALSEAGKKR